MMMPMTILVADDEPAQRELLGGFLAKRGWSVELAAGGAEALAILRRTAIDLVLADYRMPDLSGIELLKASKQLNPEVPVVLITAYGSIASAVEAMKAGAYDYLTKPIEPKSWCTSSTASLNGGSCSPRCRSSAPNYVSGSALRGLSGKAVRCRRC
jgi:DNA-binding NtrC family response regulator